MIKRAVREKIATLVIVTYSVARICIRCQKVPNKTILHFHSHQNSQSLILYRRALNKHNLFDSI